MLFICFLVIPTKRIYDMLTFSTLYLTMAGMASTIYRQACVSSQQDWKLWRDDKKIWMAGLSYSEISSTIKTEWLKSSWKKSNWEYKKCMFHQLVQLKASMSVSTITPFTQLDNQNDDNCFWRKKLIYDTFCYYT